MTLATRLTLDDFLAQPEEKPYREYIRGDVVEKLMPDNAHGTLQLFLGALILQFLARNPLGGVRSEWRCIFGPPSGERVYIPDLVFVSSERLPHGDARVNRYLRAAPDLAVEILSPDQLLTRFTEKVQFYLLYGVRLVWVVDPATETVLVLAPGQEPRTLSAGEVLEGGDVLPGFSVPLAAIFAQLHS
jgi:Uma2 family endonuclease